MNSSYKDIKQIAGEIASYRNAAMEATLSGRNEDALYWKLAAGEANNFLHQRQFFAPQKNSFFHDLVILTLTDQESQYHLARIFHTDSSRGAANPDSDKEEDQLRRRLCVSYRPRSNSILTQYPSGIRKPEQNQYEIGGLAQASEKKRSWAAWMFTKDPLSSVPTFLYRYWITCSALETSPGCEQEVATLKERLQNYPEASSLLEEALSHFEIVEKLQKENGSIEHTIFLHRAKRVAFTASYLAVLNIKISRAAKEEALFLKHILCCTEQVFSLSKDIFQATKRQEEQKAIEYSLAAYAWNTAINYCQKALTFFSTQHEDHTSLHAAQEVAWLLHILKKTNNEPAKMKATYLERILFLSENALDYRVHALEKNSLSEPLLVLLWQEAAKATERACRLWAWEGSPIASPFLSSPILAGAWKAIVCNTECQAKNKLLTIAATHHRVETNFKKEPSQKLMTKISFCLPPEGLPDAACKEIWSQGKLFPRLEFTSLHSWIYQTWDLLQQAGLNHLLSTQLLEPGITITWGLRLMNSLRSDQPLSKDIFLVDVLADGAPHPQAHLYITQNRAYARFAPHTLFMPHWPQRLLIPRDSSRGTRFENVAFFGDPRSLAPALQSETWKERVLKELGLHFFIQEPTAWHDYSNIDAIVAIRDFSTSRHFHKPATKLYNAWLAGVPFIGGHDSAYRAEGTPGKDYLVATSLEEVFQHLKRLKEDETLRQMLVENGRIAGKAFTQEATLERWKKLLEETIPARLAAWQKKSALERRWFFFVNRLICFFNYYLQ